jgi:hypothetical protein
LRQRIALLLVLVLLLALGGSGVVWRLSRERVARERVKPNEGVHGPDSAPERDRAVDDAQAHVRGVVVDEAGDAVAGAQVAAFPLTLGAPFDPAGAGVRTGADGRFRVALAGDAPAYGLFARAAGFAPRVVECVRAGDDVRIVLARGGTLFGRVTDMAGEPVPGAQVRYVGLLDGVRVEGETVSAADGVYRVATAPGAPAHIAVSAEDFAPLLVSDGPFAGERDLVLSRGGAVRATVVDGDTGKPVAGIAVRLWTRGLRDPFGPRLFGERATGPDGAAEFADVPSLGFHFGPGTMLGFVKLHDSGSFAADVEVAMPEAGATVECRVVRWPSGRLVGRVVDVEGEGLAEIPLALKAGGATSELRSDSQGRYRAAVAVRGDTPTNVTVGSVSGCEVRGTVRAGRTTRMPDLVVEVIEVEVVDEADAPVWGAGVSLDNDSVSAFTDATGRARLLGTRFDFVYVRPRHHAFAIVRAAPHVKVVVRRGEPVAGRVVWKDDQPVVGALVRIGQAVFCDWFGHRPADGGFKAITSRTRTASDGAFRFEHVPGTCEVAAHVYHDGSYGRVDLVARAKDVAAGTTDLRLVFDRDDFVPVVTVRGTVSDITTGKPIPRFRVKLYNKPRIITARRVGVGRFEVGVPKGEWWAYVTAPGYVNDSCTWVVRPGVPVPDQEFVLKPATTVTGRIRSRVPLDGGKIELGKTDNGSFAGESVIDAEGNYSVEGVVPGEYVARVSVGQTMLTDRAWRTVGVRAGVEEVRFDFEVEPGGVLRVSVRGSRELRGVDAFGVLRIEDAQGIERVHLEGPQALFSNAWHVPAGTYRVTIESRPVRGTRAAQVEVGNRTDIVFEG